MLEPLLPPDEDARLYELQCMDILDTPDEERFDSITRTTQRLFGTPVVLISLIDARRQWLKSRQGLQVRETPRSVSFCGHALHSDSVLVVPDARSDERFADNPLVVGDPHIRFYAGAPVHGPNGFRVGTLCIIAPEPRDFSAAECAALKDLAQWAEVELGNVRLNRAIREIQREIGQRVQAQQELRDFVATVAHELRTPLTSIRGMLGLLLGAQASTLTPQTRQMVTVANRNAERLGLLVNDFLDMEKIASGKMEFHLQRQPVAPLVRRALDDHAALAEAARVKLSLEEQQSGLNACVDADRLLQIITNLISNAVKFSPADTEVRVVLCAVGDSIHIAVHDVGPGISPEFASKIFQKFAQASSNSGRGKSGTGLGLAISKALAEGMGGSIGFSCPESGGTVFTVELPANARC